MNIAPLRSHLKGLLGSVLWPFPTSLASRCLIRKDQGLVLTFHYIGSPILPGVCEDLFISNREFRRVLDFVKRHLTPLPPAEFFARLSAGTLPEKATLITFDDCPHDTVCQALPELMKRGLQACFFVCPGLIGAGHSVPAVELMSMCASAVPGQYRVRTQPGSQSEAAYADIHLTGDRSRAEAYRRLWPDVQRCHSRKHAELFKGMRSDLMVGPTLIPNQNLADWKSLAALDANGMLIGNHTMLHSTVTADGVEQFESDVALAYDLLERRFGARTRVFCYPYGRKVDQPEGAEEVLRKLGTDYAFVTQGGIASTRHSGLLNLHREDAAYSAGATKLAPLLAFLR
jgi:peptidoglycan/xylan/chitin deacetylase (PgdA/CDA1 family)